MWSISTWILRISHVQIMIIVSYICCIRTKGSEVPWSLNSFAVLEQARVLATGGLQMNYDRMSKVCFEGK